MQLPLEITFRNMEPSPAIEAKVQEKAHKLDRFFEHIMSCRVVVEAPHKHKNKGKLYHVRIDVTVPDDELVASREPDKNMAHQDVYVAMRDAFDAMARQLEAYAAKRRREVKTHEAPPHGRVSEIYPGADYGRIHTPDGREIYFHRNSVLEAEFDKLEVGDEVRYHEVDGDDGPKASTVHLVGKHHIVG